MRHPVSQTKPQEIRQCRECGCVEDDCAACFERTGKPCHWIEVDLCSACGWGLTPIGEVGLPRALAVRLRASGCETAGDVNLWWAIATSTEGTKSRRLERSILAVAVAIERLAQASRAAIPATSAMLPPSLAEVSA